MCGACTILLDGKATKSCTLFAAQADGELITYDKRHLFRMSTENENFSGGQDRLTFTVSGVKVFPQVCYDLRFPVFSRNDLGFDLMLYVANWPAARREHWNALLRARAIENLCYVVGLNRVGLDGNNIDYCGDSTVVNYNGEIILSVGNRDHIASLTINTDGMKAYRTRFPAWQDADGFKLDP